MKAPDMIEADASLDQPLDRKTVLNDSLRRRIVTMELAPGAVVDEVALAEEFGLSRPPVRELMRQLAAEGYLELEPNRPARVSSMSYQSLRNFFLAAPLLYVATTQLAATNATPAEIDGLKDIQRRFRLAIDAGDVSGRVHYNDRFHFQIGQMAHNDYLMPSLRRLLIDHSRLGMTFYQHPPTQEMQDSLQSAVEQHDQIIEAIASRSPDRAGILVRAHWDLSRRRMSDYATPEGLDIQLT